MAEVARRVAGVQTAEQDLVRRITEARVQEDEAANDVQHKAEEHAKAQLELRRLDALGSQYSVPAALHEQARNNESNARQQLEKARAAREEFSRARAAVEGELNRIKAELQSANRQADAMKSAPLPSQTPLAQASPDLVAPTDAVVTEVFAQPGMWAQPQQQLIVLTPSVGSLEATAWFPEKDGANIHPGQICRVFVMEAPEKSFAGKVEQVLPAGSLAPVFPLAGPAQTRHIPVRVRFSVNDPGSYAALKSGMRAAVRVHTPPHWTRIDALAGKLRGTIK
jgi:multidrug resistance efflux pump